MLDAVKVSLESEVFFAICKSADTPTSLGAWLRFKYAEHAQLASLGIVAENYRSSEEFMKDYLVCSFLSKWKGLQTGVDVKAEAYQRFKTAEDKCAVTNRRIRDSSVHGLGHEAEQVLHHARRKIARLLGPFAWQKVLHGGWGPGATYDLKRSYAQPDRKMSEIPFSVTARCLPVFRELLAADLHWSAVICGVKPCDIWGELCFLPSVFELVKGCRLTTVPKNAETDRTIAVEPRANGFLQKGVGKYIRRRLLSVGIDLDNQGNNQRGAERALRDGLATIDLKMASDTIAQELVFLLLPVDWANALDDLRSPAFLVKNEWTRIEKFSSMGNGFTFELETLIFWAIASAVTPDDQQQDVLVYGDDVIVPAKCAPAFVDMATVCGFEVNTKKTHIAGLFYESCGRHYFNGSEVTPIYQKELVSSLPAQIRCSNRLIRYALRYADPLLGTLHPLTKSAWLASRRLVGPSQFVIPLGFDGDDGFATPRVLFPKNVQFDPNGGYRVRVLRVDTWLSPCHEGALLALSLRRMAERLTADAISLVEKRPACWTPFSLRVFASVTAKRESVRSLYRAGDDDERSDIRIEKENCFSAGWRSIYPKKEFDFTW